MPSLCNVFRRTEREQERFNIQASTQRGEYNNAATAHLFCAEDFTTCVNVPEIPVSMPPRGIGRLGTGALKQLQ